MDSISNIINIYREITDKIYSYINVFSSAYRDLYDIVSRVKRQLKKIEKMYIIPLPDDFKNIENAFIIEHVLNTIEICIFNIYDLLRNDSDKRFSDLSNSFTLNMENDFKEIEVLIKSMDNIIKNRDILLHSYLDNDNIDLKQLDSLYEKYENTIRLYTHCLYSLLLKSDNKEYKDDILIRIEKLKYETILKLNVPNKLKTHSNITNLQRYNIYATRHNMSEQDIINTIFHLKNDSKIKGGDDKQTEEMIVSRLQNLDRICKERKYGIFFNINIKNTHFMYDFNGINRTQDKKSSDFNDSTGLNINIIKTYEFITQVNTKNTDIICKNVKMGYLEANNWIMIRTLNGSTYELLGDNKKNNIFKKHIIDKIERGSSLLIDTYNKHISKIFSAHIKNKVEMLPEDKSPVNDDMVNYIINRLNTMVDYKLRYVPSNLSDLYDILTGEWLNIIQSIIFDYISNIERGLITASLLSDIDELSTTVLKFIKGGVSKLKISKNILTERSPEYVIKKIKKYSNILIEQAINKSITASSNIFTKINDRKRLLNINMDI